jgi:hypothetical protein
MMRKAAAIFFCGLLAAGAAAAQDTATLETHRRPPAGLLQASVGPDGPILEFPIIIRGGVKLFRSRKKVTVWEGPQADGRTYAQIE